MAGWSDLSELRMEMDMLQAKIRSMYKKSCGHKEIAYTLGIPEMSVRVIIKWKCKED